MIYRPCIRAAKGRALRPSNLLSLLSSVAWVSVIAFELMRCNAPLINEAGARNAFAR